MQPTDTALPQAPPLDVLTSGGRASDELKQRGFYVGFRDGMIRRPADLTEAQAREVTAMMWVLPGWTPTT
jgi:hypothetical protein